MSIIYETLHFKARSFSNIYRVTFFVFCNIPCEGILIEVMRQHETQSCNYLYNDRFDGSICIM